MPMSSLEYDSHAARPGGGARPPPLRIDDNPVVESPGPSPGPGGGGPPPGPGAMVPNMPPAGYGGALIPYAPIGVQPQNALQRLPHQVKHALVALAGPPQRQPLVYSGDAINSLSALRQDMTTQYRALCAALGEPERTDIISGYLPAAAALGLPLPAPPVGGVGAGLQRLPPLPGASSATSAPLALMGSPRDAGGSGAATGASDAVTVPVVGSTSPAGVGELMMAGNAGGIESVGSGADAPARMLGAHRSLSAGPGNPYAMQHLPSMAHIGGAARAGVMGSGFGLPPIGTGLQQQQQMWPLGRPGGGGALQGGGSMAALNGPRVSVMSGFSRPQDPGSDFLGEESALVYPPAGRSFGGGPSATARAALGAGGYGAAGGGLIDPMEDFRFRGGGPRKAITVEQLDNLESLFPGRSRQQHSGGGDQLDRYLQDYARDRAKPPSLQGIMSGNRFNMPF